MSRAALLVVIVSTLCISPFAASGSGGAEEVESRGAARAAELAAAAVKAMGGGEAIARLESVRTMASCASADGPFSTEIAFRRPESVVFRQRSAGKTSTLWAVGKEGWSEDPATGERRPLPADRASALLAMARGHAFHWTFFSIGELEPVDAALDGDDEVLGLPCTRAEYRTTDGRRVEICFELEDHLPVLYSFVPVGAPEGISGSTEPIRIHPYRWEPADGLLWFRGFVLVQATEGGEEVFTCSYGATEPNSVPASVFEAGHLPPPAPPEAVPWVEGSIEDRFVRLREPVAIEVPGHVDRLDRPRPEVLSDVDTLPRRAQAPAGSLAWLGSEEFPLVAVLTAEGPRRLAADAEAAFEASAHESVSRAEALAELDRLLAGSRILATWERHWGTYLATLRPATVDGKGVVEIHDWTNDTFLQSFGGLVFRPGRTVHLAQDGRPVGTARIADFGGAFCSYGLGNFGLDRWQLEPEADPLRPFLLSLSPWPESSKEPAALPSIAPLLARPRALDWTNYDLQELLAHHDLDGDGRPELVWHHLGFESDAYELLRYEGEPGHGSWVSVYIGGGGGC